MAERRPPPRPLPTFQDLPSDAQAHVSGLPEWLRGSAIKAFPTPAVETEARKQEAERSSADRTAWFLTVRELCQRAKAGDFGPACKAAVDVVLSDPDPGFTPAMKAVDCEKIINAARKVQAEEARKAKRPPGRGAP